ncbi:MAG: FAD-binding protein [Acidimicrobiales bacterium]
MMRTVDDALVAFAAEIGTDGAVAVEGARTRWDRGGAPVAGTRIVQAPRGVVEHRPEEMTVRVRAGTTVADLEAVLSPAGQRSALPDRGGTVGGALAVGENHLDLGTRRTVRESLLEVRYVSAEGRVVTGGGPTVKNVSGFDLPRLFVGSLGTLGCIAEVVLRVNPVPAASRWLRCADADPLRVHAMLWRPACVVGDGSVTWVHLEGHAVDVEAQIASLGAGWEDVDGPPPLPPHRWSVPTGEVGDPAPRPPGRFVASYGVGILFADEPQPPRPLPAAVAAISVRMKENFDPTGRLNPGRTP